MSRPRALFLLRFAFLWLCTGVVLGTFTLLGPVRWVAVRVRQGGGSQAAEDWSVRVVIALFVVASFFVARWLTRVSGDGATRRAKLFVPVAAALASVVTLALWLNPAWVARHGTLHRAPGEQFSFGPYPTEDDLRSIKADGYTAVVSLLSNAVPFEPKLQADEEAAARRVGIRVIHLPMLPWVSQNSQALDGLRALARGGRGPYYVHCYLGKDRVNVARRALAAMGIGGDTTADARQLAGLRAMERGEVVRLDRGLYLTPMPTDEEYFGYVIAGSVKTVVTLLDPASRDDAPFVAKERQLAAKYGFRLEVVPLPAAPWLPDSALAVARRIRALPRPLVVHAFLTRSPPSEGVLQAFRSGLPPVPPTLFAEAMRHGKADVVAPNVVLGPAPDADEVGRLLKARGIRGIVWTGGEPGGSIRAAAREAGIDVRQSPADAESVAAMVKAGGPWYVTGPGAAGLREALASRLGPPLGR